MFGTPCTCKKWFPHPAATVYRLNNVWYILYKQKLVAIPPATLEQAKKCLIHPAATVHKLNDCHLLHRLKNVWYPLYMQKKWLPPVCYPPAQARKWLPPLPPAQAKKCLPHPAATAIHRLNGYHPLHRLKNVCNPCTSKKWFPHATPCTAEKILGTPCTCKKWSPSPCHTPPQDK